MKRLSWLLSLAITTTFTAGVLADGDHDTATLKQITNYRDWTRVNPDPIEVSVPATRTDEVVSLNPAALT